MKLDLSKNSDNLRNRLIYGFSGFFMMMGGILWIDWSYFVVFLVICFFCQFEFYRLLEFDGKKPLKMYGISTGLFIYVLSFLVGKELLSPNFFLLIFPFFSLVFIIKLYDKSEKQPFENIALTLLGLVYTAIPFAALNLAVFVQGQYSYQVILGTFFIIWIYDISAYFVGFRYGKHRLFERISPKKSWEGTFAGLGQAAVMVLLLSYYLKDLFWWQWAGIALIIVVISTYGDLVESMFKRSMQVKDSGEAIPGHGGFLDRFDGLLLAAPFIAAFLKIF